jgi:hypothetical protein
LIAVDLDGGVTVLSVDNPPVTVITADARDALERPIDLNPSDILLSAQ